MLISDFPKFCPKKDCPCYQSLNNKITKDVTKKLKLSGERRQMYYCHGGQHRFCETAYSDLWRKQGSEKEYIQTTKLSTYGLSAEQIADVLERNVRTIEGWLSGISEKSQRFHESICLMVGVTLQFLQMDELWSYLRKKNRQIWVFLALDTISKFWINFELGSRTNHTANRFVRNLKVLIKLNPNQILKVTNDKLSAYKNA
jgi:hypothetical protein